MRAMNTLTIMPPRTPGKPTWRPVAPGGFSLRSPTMLGLSPARRQTMTPLVVLAGALLAGARLQEASAADFALRDGDTVVFLGDSITAARTYGRIVENYTLLRFPGRKVHFLNA